jgi:two-component system, response regulator PdtaR
VYAPDDEEIEASAIEGTDDRDLLRGLKILLVEDDFIVAFDMQTLLQDYGADVLGPAATVAEGLSVVANSKVDAAVLDVNLNGEFVFALAQRLREQSVPLLFATAYADDDKLFPDADRVALRVAKPVLPNVLIAQLRKLVGR